MLEQIVTQVVFDIAADIENDEAREPADRAEHQREDDHHSRVMRDEVGPMLVGRVDRVADEQGNDHRECSVREGASYPEYVTQPVASRVGKQASHGLTVKLSGLWRDRSGWAPKFQPHETASGLYPGARFQPAFVELCVFQKYVERRRHRRV